MVVNGEELTIWEQHLIQFGDVADISELRDVPALRARQAGASILGRVRLQRQIDAVLGAINTAGQAIDQAKQQ